MTVNDSSDRRGLHPRVRTLWRVRGLLAALPGLIVAAGLAVVAAPWPPYLAAALLAGLGVAAGWWWAERRFVRFSYVLDGDVLRVADGVVVLTDSAVPLFRVQHIDVDRDPVERWLGLATLVIHTAAPRADVALPGVAAGEATAVRDEILVASREAAARSGIEDLDAV